MSDSEGLLLQEIDDSLLSIPSYKHACPIPLWQILLGCLLLVIFAFVGSAIVCGTDAACTNHLPTVANMLNSTMALPFVVTGFNTGFAIYFLIVFAIASVTRVKAPYWAIIQSFLSIIVFVCVFFTLALSTYVRWKYNWANISILVSLAVWMLAAQIALRRGLRETRRWSFTIMYLYCVCILIYIVVRAVPTLPIPNKDIGILVCEIVGGLSVALYIFVCFWHVKNARVHVDVAHKND